MATLSPIRPTERIDRPRTAPPRSGSVGILRTSSSESAGEAPAGSLGSTPSNISFAPLPEIGPRKRRGNRPLGVAARSSILHRQRANPVRYSEPTPETEYQYQQQSHPFDTSEDPPQLWPGMDDSQYALQLAMAAGAPEPSNTESPVIVYVENGEPQQSDAPQVLVSVSIPKRNRSRKGSLSKSPNKSKNTSERATEEGALHELRKMGSKDKLNKEGSGLKFWKRLAKRNSTPILPIFKLPNDQIPELPTTAAGTTIGNSLVGHQSDKQPGGTSPPVTGRRPSDIATDVISPLIFISPVEVPEPHEATLSPNQSETSTAASSSPPTPEMRIQSVSPVEVSGSYDTVPTPRPLAANGAQRGGDKDSSLPVVEFVGTKRHSEEPYSQYERVAVPLMSSASL